MARYDLPEADHTFSSAGWRCALRTGDAQLAGSNRPLTLVQRAFSPSSDNLGRRVVDSAAFTFLGIAIRTGITLGSMAILARLLTPADFGHIAMATVVTELAALFANFGFGYILIQRSKIARIQIDTMFWAALWAGRYC